MSYSYKESCFYLFVWKFPLITNGYLEFLETNRELVSYCLRKATSEKEILWLAGVFYRFYYNGEIPVIPGKKK